MKPLLCAFILVLLSSCSTVPRTTSSPAMGVTQVKKPPFTIIELSLTPWAAGREEGGTGYLFELTLSEPFASLDSIVYKGNRAVIFNSNLFHETDSYEFKEGYENRRINVTMLFGDRRNA